MYKKRPKQFKKPLWVEKAQGESKERTLQIALFENKSKSGKVYKVIQFKRTIYTSAGYNPDGYFALSPKELKIFAKLLGETIKKHELMQVE